jgi:hypothetical protein
MMQRATGGHASTPRYQFHLQEGVVEAGILHVEISDEPGTRKGMKGILGALYIG